MRKLYFLAQSRCSGQLLFLSPVSPTLPEMVFSGSCPGSGFVSAIHTLSPARIPESGSRLWMCWDGGVSGDGGWDEGFSC